MKTNVFFHVLMGGLSGGAAESATPILGLCTGSDEGESSGANSAFRAARIAPPPPPKRVSRPDLTPTPFIGVSIASSGSRRFNIGVVSSASALARFRDVFSEMRGAVDIENHVNSEVESFHAWQDRLAFLDGAFKTIMAGAVRFSISERARIVHFLAGLCDVMDVETANDGERVALIGIMRQFQLAMDGVEKAQLTDRRPARAMALYVADTYFSYARKSEYLRYLVSLGSMSGQNGELKLASTVLRLRDVVRRYGLEHDDSGIAAVLSFLGQLRDEGVLPANEVTWALNRIVMFMERNAAEWAGFMKAGGAAHVLQQRVVVFERFLNDVTRALYLYSPFILQSGERIMREAGFDDLAFKLRTKALVHGERAVKLDLL
jgi:hypothetical protein